MNVEAIARLQARIREIEKRLRDLEACELTEGWATSGMESPEAAELCQERERLRRALIRAA